MGEGVGVRAGAAVFALVERGDLVHIAGVQLEVEDFEVLLMRDGVTDFGNTMSPRWMCQRSTTWAGVLPTFSAIPVMVGSSAPRPALWATRPRWRSRAPARTRERRRW